MYRFIVNWNGVVGEASTTFYSGPGETTPDAGAAQDLHDGVVGFFTAIRPQLPSSVSISSTTTVDIVQDQSGTLLDTIPVTGSAALVGQGGTAFAYPAGALVRLNTGQFINGRVLKGRIFLVPLDATGAFTGGIVNAGTRVAIDSAAAGLLAAVPDLGVWHRPKGGTGGLLVPVTSAVTSPTVAVLTSRRD